MCPKHDYTSNMSRQTSDLIIDKKHSVESVVPEKIFLIKSKQNLNSASQSQIQTTSVSSIKTSKQNWSHQKITSYGNYWNFVSTWFYSDTKYIIPLQVPTKKYSKQL